MTTLRLIRFLVLVPLAVTWGCAGRDPGAGAPLAHYRFDGDAVDATGRNPAFRLINTRFIDHALYLNGIYGGNGNEHYVATCTTRDLDYQRFTVALRFKAETFPDRGSNLITGGSACRWFSLSRGSDGAVEVALDNGEFRYPLPDAPVQSGAWTVVACSVDIPRGTILASVDGGPVRTIGLPSGFTLGVQDPQTPDDRNWSFTNYGNGGTFHGLVDEFIVYDRALDGEALAKIPLRP